MLGLTATSGAAMSRGLESCLEHMSRSEATRPLSGPRAILGWLILVIFSLAIGLAVSEAAIRLIEPRSDKTPQGHWIEGQVRLWRYLPNLHTIRNGVLVETNSHGQRGGEYAPAKGDQLFRVIGLGDSYTFGTGVPFPDTYLEVLRGLLEQDRPQTGLDYEVLNFGVEGYNTRQEAAYFASEGPVLKPDLVLLGYLFNDIDANPSPTDAPAPAGPTGGRKSLTRAIISLKDRSHLFAFLSPRLGAWLRKLGMRQHGYVGAYANEFREDGDAWRQSREEILRLRAQVEAGGGRFALIIFPAFVSLGRKEYPLLPYHQAVSRFCQEQGIPYVDIYPFFADEKGRDFWINLIDPHPNAKADRRVGEILYRFLKEQGLVPAARGEVRPGDGAR
jgi:lysophospholipase L1-like esterase